MLTMWKRGCSNLVDHFLNHFFIPQSLLKKYITRINHVHFKDIRKDILNKSFEQLKKQDLLLLTLEVIKKDNNISLRTQEVLSLRKFINEKK